MKTLEAHGFPHARETARSKGKRWLWLVRLLQVQPVAKPTALFLGVRCSCASLFFKTCVTKNNFWRTDLDLQKNGTDSMEHSHLPRAQLPLLGASSMGTVRLPQLKHRWYPGAVNGRRAGLRCVWCLPSACFLPPGHGVTFHHRVSSDPSGPGQFPRRSLFMMLLRV